MEYFGIKLDKVKNEVRGETINLTGEGGKTQVWAVATNEELLIARDTFELVTK